MYVVMVKAEVDQPNTDNQRCRQWNKVAEFRTWAAAQKSFQSWVASHGATHSVEVYWIGEDLTPTGKPRSHQHRFHFADAAYDSMIAEQSGLANT